MSDCTTHGTWRTLSLNAITCILYCCTLLQDVRVCTFVFNCHAFLAAAVAAVAVRHRVPDKVIHYVACFTLLTLLNVKATIARTIERTSPDLPISSYKLALHVKQHLNKISGMREAKACGSPPGRRPNVYTNI